MTTLFFYYILFEFFAIAFTLLLYGFLSIGIDYIHRIIHY